MDNENRQWYTRWFDRDYLTLYRHRGEGDAATFLDCLSRYATEWPEQEPVLDLACGSGRHLRTIQRKYGWNVYGLDLSSVMLREAHAVLQKGAGADFPIPLIRGDMRSLPFADARFGLVFSAFTSFGYFNSDEEHLKTLQEVARVLKSEAVFVLDLLNPEVIVSHLIPEDRIERDGMVAVQRRRYDESTRRIMKYIQLTRPDGQTREITEVVRVFHRDEIEELLERAGFATQRILGDYLGSGFRAEQSERMILMNRKRR